MPIISQMDKRYLVSSILIFSLFETACVRENKASIQFDSINNPSLTVTFKSEELYTNLADQEIALSSDRTIQSYAASVSLEPACSGQYQLFEQDKKIILSLLSVTQEQYVNVIVKSSTGFPSKCISRKIILDTKPPVVGAISLTSNRGSRSRTPRVLPPVVTDEGSGVGTTEIRLVYKGDTVIKDWTVADPNSLYFSFSGAALLADAVTPDQSYQIQLRARDKVGNVSSSVVTSDSFLVGPSATLTGLDASGVRLINNQQSGAFIQFNLSSPAPANSYIRVLAESSGAAEGIHYSFPTIVPIDVYASEGATVLRVFFTLFPSKMLIWPKGEVKNFKLKFLGANNIGLDKDEVTVSLFDDRDPLPDLIPTGYTGLTMMAKAGCAVSSSKKLDCWGQFFSENFLDGEKRVYPQPVLGATEVSRVYRAYSTSLCFSKTDDSLWCLGKNDGSVLGQSQANLAKSLLPVRIGQGTGIDKVKKAESGVTNICALNFANELFCWGEDLKNITPVGGDRLLPTKIPNLTKVIDFSLVNGVACAIDEVTPGNRVVKCWGDADINVANFSSVNVTSSAMITISGINDLPVEVSLGRYFDLPYTGCVRTVNHKVYCWGNAYFRRRGAKTGTGQFLVANEAILNLTNNSVLTGGGLISLSVGNATNCVITAKKELWCWGDVIRNPDDLSMIATAAEATKVLGLDPVILANTNGALGNCALTVEGKIQCWGANTFAEIGNGYDDFNFRPGSTRTYGNEKIKNVLTMDYSTCVINMKDELRCWGRNTRGHLGVNSSFDANPILESPPIKPTLSNVDKVRGKGRFICATTKDGKFYCWGDDEDFQTLATSKVSGTTGARLDPTLLYTSPPSEIPLGPELTYSDGTKYPGFNSTVKDFDVSYSHACLLTQDNKLRCWGTNSNGQTCSTNIGMRLTFPCLNNSLPAGSTTLRVSLGVFNTCAIVKLSGGLKQAIYCNGGFDVGLTSSQNQKTNTFLKIAEYDYTPTTEITEVSIGTSVGCYIYMNKTYCWGRATAGPLPGAKHGDSTEWLSPQEVPDLAGATTLSVTEFSGCATMKDLGIKCWGLNLSGLMKAPIGDRAEFSPSIVYPFSNLIAKKVSLSPIMPDILSSDATYVRYDLPHHYCAIGYDDILQCWGGSAVGEAVSETLHVSPVYVKKYQLNN